MNTIRNNYTIAYDKLVAWMKESGWKYPESIIKPIHEGLNPRIACEWEPSSLFAKKLDNSTEMPKKDVDFTSAF